MKIVRSLSIDLEVWESARSHCARHGVSFSAFAEKSIIAALKEPEDVVSGLGPPRTYFAVPGDTNVEKGLK